MSGVDPGDARGEPVRLLHKIIAYVAIWITALLLTAPGLWPLAWMFPLGLLAVINRHAANAGGLVEPQFSSLIAITDLLQ